MVRGVGLEIYRDSFTVILGQSGSGKSPMLNILSGQIRPTGGRVLYNGQDITGFAQGQLADWKRAEISNVFQNDLLSDSLSAEDNIRIGIAPGKDPLPFPGWLRFWRLGMRRTNFPPSSPAANSGGSPSPGP